MILLSRFSFSCESSFIVRAIVSFNYSMGHSRESLAILGCHLRESWSIVILCAVEINPNLIQNLHSGLTTTTKMMENRLKKTKVQSSLLFFQRRADLVLNFCTGLKLIENLGFGLSAYSTWFVTRIVGEFDQPRFPFPTDGYFSCLFYREGDNLTSRLPPPGL